MEDIKKQLKTAIMGLFGVEIEPEVTLAPEETGADYASNVAMRLAKVARKAPIAIAEELKEALEPVVKNTQIEVAAPGFLNFRLDDTAVAKAAAQYAKPFESEFLSGEYRDKTVVAEFSDPNPFKVLHVGHLYTSVVGDAISRILGLAGAKVVRANFGGDVGLHVGKTMWALRKRAIGELSIEEIAECYVEGTRAYEEDETAKTEITVLNKVIYALAELGEQKSQERLELETVAEDYDMATTEVAQVAELYWRGRELSYEYFKDFYAKIGVKFDKFYPESSVADKGLEEVKAHIGTTYEESDGAIVYKGEKVGLHTRVFINREGVPTYETKDVGLIFTKWADWHFDESVVITGNEQTDYMKVVLASVQEYAPELVERTRHLTHGMVRLPGNEKMSSRKGNFLKAIDVLEMVSGELPEASAKQMITLAAVKYAFLKYKMGGDIVFDPKESVSMTGNSGVYLLYAAVRARKVLEKVANGEAHPAENLSKNSVQEVGDSEKGRGFERRLNKKIVQYGDVIRGAIDEKAPYKICAYLYELAQEFSRFYENVKVAGSDRENEKVVIVRAYLNVMEHGLGLLGIEVPEEM